MQHAVIYLPPGETITLSPLDFSTKIPGLPVIGYGVSSRVSQSPVLKLNFLVADRGVAPSLPPYMMNSWSPILTNA